MLLGFNLPLPTASPQTFYSGLKQNYIKFIGMCGNLQLNYNYETTFNKVFNIEY